MNSLQQITFKQLFYGRPLPKLHSFAMSFLDKCFDQMLYSPAVQRLQHAQQQGHYTVILSSSPNFLVALFAKRFGVDEWGATKYDVDNLQCFSSISHIMTGSEKANYLNALANHLNIPKCNITGYSDSYLDLPLLMATGVAVGVNPDRALRSACKKNHWQIV